MRALLVVLLPCLASVAMSELVAARTGVAESVDAFWYVLLFVALATLLGLLLRARGLRPWLIGASLALSHLAWSVAEHGPDPLIAIGVILTVLLAGVYGVAAYLGGALRRRDRPAAR